MANVMMMPDVMFGMSPPELAMFAMYQRRESPACMMPWDWSENVDSVPQQIMREVSMMLQYANENRDWLREPHLWGPHWYIQPWETSPNDRS